MVELTVDCERRAGVTLVRARVTNTRRTPQRVTVESRLSGPVWPPRRGPVSAPEWDGDTWEGVVRPGRTRGVGFASPAAPEGTPVELVATARADGADPDPLAVLASLDGWAPPTDAVDP